MSSGEEEETTVEPETGHMGNCVSSVPKGQSSTMKFNWSVSSKADSVLVESPVKESRVGVQNSVSELGRKAGSPAVWSLRELGSKEEIFFDSQPWLDSDCEDYFSVCDDTTPSYGNTPVHPSSFIERPKLDKPLFVETALDPASAHPKMEVKKQLFELFNESFRANPVEMEAKYSVPELPANSPSKSSYDSPYVKPRSAPPSQRCFPKLVRSLSLGERKKRLKAVAV